MAPLDLNLQQDATLTNKNNQNADDNQFYDLHPEAYKVKGPSPEKMKSVSTSLRSYGHGLYGLL
ncbi:hypothetical protein [Pedobacter jejuensis]|uniref:Uncharacterized protein n=1 Tax=Pedobacter jejuensis TaxID=1268550 RepID=A0A3N0BXS4_9SPHI|nr:hypothetical protein [Pedobacter jejuensis]RNL54290.1 hypothetical protein D7004_09390 [Pedobacter jejuensis]